VRLKLQKGALFHRRTGKIPEDLRKMSEGVGKTEKDALKLKWRLFFDDELLLIWLSKKRSDKNGLSHIELSPFFCAHMIVVTEYVFISIACD